MTAVRGRHRSEDGRGATADARQTGGAEGGHGPSPAAVWRARCADALPLLVVVALLALAPLLLSDFRLGLLGRYLAYAILAVGLDLAWGYGGMLSLGHGLFFGLGGYAMAMHLKLAATPTGLPDFMGWSGVSALPWWWRPFSAAPVALVAAVVVPAVVGGLLGYMVFRNRIRGAYFAILTQALVVIFVTLLVGQQGYTGGTNGLTNLSAIFGLPLAAPETKRLLYAATAVTLVVILLAGRALVRSRWGRLLLACRDGEDRVRFLGYDPAWVKTVAFATSAAVAGLAGALFVPLVGIMAPGLLGVIPSIQMVIWVAIGGRGTLLGPAVGAVLFGYGATTFSEQLPSAWLYLQGAALIVVLMVAPRGLAGVGAGLARLSARAVSRLRSAGAREPA